MVVVRGSLERAEAFVHFFHCFMGCGNLLESIVLRPVSERCNGFTSFRPTADTHHPFMAMLAVIVAVMLQSASAKLVFSAGFSDNAVLQRSFTDGAAVYGFTDTSSRVSVQVSGTDGSGSSVSYSVDAAVHAWTGGASIYPSTPAPPPHGDYVWRAQLKPTQVRRSADYPPPL